MAWPPPLSGFLAREFQRLLFSDSLLRLCSLQDSIYLARGTSSHEANMCDDRTLGVVTATGIEHMKYGK